MVSRLSDSAEFPALNADRSVGKKRGKEPAAQKGESKDETSYAESASVSKITMWNRPLVRTEDDNFSPQTSTSTSTHSNYQPRSMGKSFASASASESSACWVQKTTVQEASTDGSGGASNNVTMIVGCENDDDDVHNEEATIVIPPPPTPSRKHSTTSSSDSSVSTVSTVSPVPPPLRASNNRTTDNSDEKEKEKSSSSMVMSVLSSPQGNIVNHHNPMAFEEATGRTQRVTGAQKDTAAVPNSNSNSNSATKKNVDANPGISGSAFLSSPLPVDSSGAKTYNDGPHPSFPISPSRNHTGNAAHNLGECKHRTKPLLTRPTQPRTPTRATQTPSQSRVQASDSPGKATNTKVLSSNPGYVPLLPGSGSWKQVQQLRHTVMCAYYNTPTGCFKGDACYHAHSNEGLRQKPMLRKTMLCKSFARGRCPKSKEQCPYAHGTGELAATDTFFKTVRCRAAVGKCKMGDNCRYAHSDEDLIKIDDAVSRGLKSEGVIITQTNSVRKEEVHDDDDDGTNGAAGTLMLKEKENEKEAVKQKMTHVGGGEKEKQEGMKKTMEESEPMEESESMDVDGDNSTQKEPTTLSGMMNVYASSTLDRVNRVIGRAAVGPEDDNERKGENSKVFSAASAYQKENEDEKRIIKLDAMIGKSLHVIDTVFKNGCIVDEETCGTPLLLTAPNAAGPDTTPPCFPRATPAFSKPEKKKNGGMRRKNHSNFQHQRFVDCYKSGAFTADPQSQNKKYQRGELYPYPPSAGIVEKRGPTPTKLSQPSLPPPPPAPRLSSLASRPINKLTYQHKESSITSAYPPSPLSDQLAKESCFPTSAADARRMIPVSAYPPSPLTSSRAEALQLLNLPLNGYEPKFDESNEMRDDTPTRESVKGGRAVDAPPMTVDTPQKSTKNQNYYILNKQPPKMEMEKKDEDAKVDDDMRFLSEEIQEYKETEYFCATPDFMEDLEPNDIYLGEGKMAMLKTPTMMASMSKHTNTYMMGGMSAPENNLYLMNGPGMMIVNQGPMMTEPNSYGIQHPAQHQQHQQANFNMGCNNTSMMWNQSYHPPSPYDRAQHMGAHPQTQMISNPIPTNCTPPAL